MKLRRGSCNLLQCLDISDRAMVLDPDYQYAKVQKKSKAFKTIEKEDYITVSLPEPKKSRYDCYDLFISAEDEKKIIVLDPNQFPEENAVFVFRLDLEELSLAGQWIRRKGALKTLYIIRPESW